MTVVFPESRTFRHAYGRLTTGIGRDLAGATVTVGGVPESFRYLQLRAGLVPHQELQPPGWSGALLIGMCPPPSRPASRAASAHSRHLPGAKGIDPVPELYAAKGHEITAIPHLLDRIVPGALVTLDIAGCRTAIV